LVLGNPRVDESDVASSSYAAALLDSGTAGNADVAEIAEGALGMGDEVFVWASMLQTGSVRARQASLLSKHNDEETPAHENASG
jgi:hypothetical protein